MHLESGTWATQASPLPTSATPAPTGKRGFFLLNLTPIFDRKGRPYHTTNRLVKPVYSRDDPCGHPAL